MKKVKKWVRNWILNILPDRLRNKLVRNSIRLPLELSKDLVFKIAETTGELEAAFRLVYESYLPLGYCEPNEFRMRATVYHALPTTTTMIALDKGRLVGTLTVVRDNRLGLPLDNVFNVKALRKEAHRLAEVTSLVIHKDYRREKGGQILFPLLRLMYEYSTYYFGVRHLLVSVHPKDRHFYKSLLLFKDIPNTGEKDYLGAPAVALHLDLQQALNDYEETYSPCQLDKNLFDFFVKRQIANLRLPKRKFNTINDQVVSLSYYQKVFLQQLKVPIKTFDRRRIESILTDVPNTLRSDRRVEVETPAEIVHGALITLSASRASSVRPKGAQHIRAIVKDVSRKGFRAFLKEEISTIGDFFIKIEVAKDVFANVKAKVIWMSPHMGVGFQILESDQNWQKYVNYLYKNKHLKAA